MNKLLLCAPAVFFSIVVAGSAGAQTLGTTPSTPSWVAQVLPLTLNTISAIPPLADDPLLDAKGSVVLDSSGNPVSDPKEQFHRVKPQEFDPARTQLVQAAWLNGTGCPTGAFTYDGSSTAPFTDTACPTGDAKDQHIEGLLLVKTGPTANFAAATAELKKVRGITLSELGYDIRKSGDSGASPLGSHCGAGAPRFNVVTQDNVVHFIGCNSPPGVVMSASTTGWVRLRWGATELAAAFPPIAPTDVVSRIFIVFDEGQDPSGGPDQFGAAFLDNIDVNGMLVGHGATDAD
jgi:hypothetical protein